MPPKTFEAKIHHLETRLSRKPREGTAELEYFVRCEVHSSDLNTFISSIKRVAEDVRTTKEDKCKELTNCFALVRRLSCRDRVETLLFSEEMMSFCVLNLSRTEKNSLWDTWILKATSLLDHFSADSRVCSQFCMEKRETGDEMSCFDHTSPTKFSSLIPVFQMIKSLPKYMSGTLCRSSTKLPDTPHALLLWRQGDSQCEMSLEICSNHSTASWKL